MKSINPKPVVLSMLVGAAAVLTLQVAGLKPELHAAPIGYSPTYRVVKWAFAQEDLQPILDKNAKDGWHLHSISEGNVIFEK